MERPLGFVRLEQVGAKEQTPATDGKWLLSSADMERCLRGSLQRERRSSAAATVSSFPALQSDEHNTTGTHAHNAHTLLHKRLLSARGKGRGTFRQASEMKHRRQWGEKRSLETPVFLLTKQKSHRRRGSVSHRYRGLCSCAPAPIPVLQEACCLVL